MKFSEKWLREWIDLKVESHVLYDQISSAGIEVESIEKFKPVLNGVVVGKIIKCITHSQSDKLKIIKVDIGIKKLLNIVCGASNCRNGIKVAVATIGSLLKKNIKIDIKFIKGELSEGMLCSYFDLGMFYSNKVIELTHEIPLGTSINNCSLLQDNIIKVSITSNRPDGLSILGISRNIAAINNFRQVTLKQKIIPAVIQRKIKINIQSEKKCIRYSGRIIENINVNVDTPDWMKKKLFFSDMLSENIITNIINYVLIEFGQPLNALDSDYILEKNIIVRMAKDYENIVLQDNTQITLNKNILVFSDRKKILSLPGNINSHHVDINKNTKNIFLNAYLIKKGSMFDIFKLVNNNKILEYYNYGIDPLKQFDAIEYATDLIIKICGGIPGPINTKDINSFIFYNNKTIRLNHKVLNKKIGFFIHENIISKILYNLDYQLTFTKTFWDVVPPSWRFDILIEEDVISDIIRIYGYNNISLTPLQENLNIIKKNKSVDFLLSRSTTILVNKGYYEAINYGFIDPKICNIIFPNEEKILLSNPISQDMSCMRSSLWPGLLKNISYNKNRQQQSIRFFESGFCFSIDKEETLGIRQDMFLSGVISGNFIEENWHDKTRKVDFYDLKGDLESVLESICDINNIEFQRKLVSGLHPEQSAAIYLKNNYIGSIGAIDPRLEKKLNVNSATFLFEISFKNFLNIKPLKIKEISKFPTIRRDIAILIAEDIPAYAIIKKCKKFFTNKKVEINLFDVYSCKEFASQKKSLGISFIFQDEKKTLQDNEIDLMMNDCIKTLKEKFQVILRK
ncbi:phenylalanine--tRNA ligase subunit beta [Buchnera aphidicola]|uniref:Phenylalanine--tRNA ligase beta subunit n=1 Tax=Buchnera aphidicola (Artemisaphis artemisicola) TaxID=1241836 RepID=A0A4D6XPD9_9GAMM|nr:phenylalanine--tRNA ligase subunit beta [Buchnera aphidicola]QCI15821.1 phenylalanine--tRNA ligase subunit beta [Buchnera aphidicola (Artemisaphis artemisicola)]